MGFWLIAFSGTGWAAPQPRHSALDDYEWNPAPFEWVDLSNSGINTGISGDDACGGPFAIGFPFPFYGVGQTYDSFRVSTNGVLTFGGCSPSFENTTIPTAAEPNNAVYAFWDDLLLADPATSWIKYRNDPQQITVAWHIAGGYDFEVILHSDGRITLQYLTLPQETSSCTIGIENAGGTEGLQICANGAGTLPQSNSAFLIRDNMGPTPSYHQDFEAANGGWAAQGGLWQWGTPTNPEAPQPHSGLHMWGTGMTADYVNGHCGYLYLDPGMEVISPSATVEFWYWYAIEMGWDACNFQISTDHGDTWQVLIPEDEYSQMEDGLACVLDTVAWTGTDGNYWHYAVFSLEAYVGMTPQFRFAFASDASMSYAGLFFDDMTMWGMQAALPPSQVCGLVRHLGGTNPPIPSVQVYAEGQTDTAITDASGNYCLPLDPGTYTLWFHPAIGCDTSRQVVIEEHMTTTLDVSLRSPVCQPSVTSLMFIRRQLPQQQTFIIINPAGTCPLRFALMDTSEWLSCAPDTGTIMPGDTMMITVTATPANPQGEMHTTIRLVCNAPGSPFIIQVDVFGEPGSADDNGNLLPTEFALHANYPNPFNPTTVLPFDVPRTSQVDIVVYNVIGQEVAHPVSTVYAAGRYNFTFDAANLPSGLYLAQMKAENFTALHKMMLLK